MACSCVVNNDVIFYAGGRICVGNGRTRLLKRAPWVIIIIDRLVWRLSFFSGVHLCMCKLKRVSRSLISEYVLDLGVFKLQIRRRFTEYAEFGAGSAYGNQFRLLRQKVTERSTYTVQKRSVLVGYSSTFFKRTKEKIPRAKPMCDPHSVQPFYYTKSHHQSVTMAPQ